MVSFRRPYSNKQHYRSFSDSIKSSNPKKYKNNFYFIDWKTTITSKFKIHSAVLSIRFEVSGYLGKVPARRYYEKQFRSRSPISSIGVKLLQTEFSVANFGNWSFNISLLLCNKCLTDCLFLLKIFHLLTYKPAAWVSHKNSSKRTCSYWLLVTEF